jgi:hypothetical protein
MKVCTEVVVEALDEAGHITAASVETVSVVPDDHAHPDPPQVEVGTRLYFVNPITVQIRP